MQAKIAVIGAGIIGLTSAIQLQKQGCDVTILAKDIEDNITSRAAPAFWNPFKATPENLVLAWAQESLPYYEQFDKNAGVELINYQEFHTTKVELPLWARILKRFEEIAESELPPYYAYGYATQLYRIDTSLFLDYLLNQFQSLKGHIIPMHLHQIDDVPQEYPVVINCCGVSANTFVSDNDCFPIRGQFLITEKPNGLDSILFADLDEESYVLIVPRTNDCYLGGTTNYGNWNTAVNVTTSKNILTNAQILSPLLKGIQVKKAGVGLRPGRTRVRVEKEIHNNRVIIHNYGHGGSGFTIGWGCADTVVKLVQSL